MERDAALVVGHRTQEPTDGICHLQLSHHFEFEDSCGGELLRHRHEVVDGVAVCRDLRFAICHAEAGADQKVAAARGNHGTAGPSGPGIIDELSECLLGGLGLS
jgi:hypothetical protein